MAVEYHSFLLANFISIDGIIHRHIENTFNSRKPFMPRSGFFQSTYDDSIVAIYRYWFRYKYNKDDSKLVLFPAVKISELLMSSYAEMCTYDDQC